MARYEMVMPKLGESIIEATIITWTKKLGEPVQAEETVLEIATDKVDSEVPAPVDGVLHELLFKDGDVVPVGTVIAILETEPASVAAPAPVVTAQPAPQPVAPPQPPVFGQMQPAEPIPVANPAVVHALTTEPVRGRFYSPLVLNIARQENIAMDELDRMPGTGSEGRVTKQDILAYVAQRKGGTVAAPPAPVAAPAAPAPVIQSTSAPAAPVQSAPLGKEQSGYVIGATGAPTNGSAAPRKTYSINGPVEIVEMDRMRKLIAENMSYSKHTAAHVTSFVEADVTNLVLWRERVKNDFQKQYGQKLSFTPCFVEVLARVLREMPMLNSSIDGDKIIVKKDINVCLAVALPNGNLIVPSIRKADRLNLAGLATACNDLTERARLNKLMPDDLADGTYTLSNVGTFGNLMGTPIIMQPQVGVLATGAIKKKPAVIETPTGDLIGIRHLMFLSHSYDHRVIDGALGGKFVRRVADLLEEWDLERGI